ncbi:MAG: hypothetical protein HFG16_04260 [Erysipelotrichaceae bacterium]|jgi:hypothetical protein|nr:hypothetical protein [Erysipelotrichaceae bacterium]
MPLYIWTSIRVISFVTAVVCMFFAIWNPHRTFMKRKKSKKEFSTADISYEDNTVKLEEL